MQAQLDARDRRAEDGRRLGVRHPFGLDQLERGPLRLAHPRQRARELGARFACRQLLLARRCAGRERRQPIVVEPRCAPWRWPRGRRRSSAGARSRTPRASPSAPMTNAPRAQCICRTSAGRCPRAAPSPGRAGAGSAPIEGRPRRRRRRTPSRLPVHTGSSPDRCCPRGPPFAVSDTRVRLAALRWEPAGSRRGKSRRIGGRRRSTVERARTREPALRPCRIRSRRPRKGASRGSARRCRATSRGARSSAARAATSSAPAKVPPEDMPQKMPSCRARSRAHAIARSSGMEIRP